MTYAFLKSEKPSVKICGLIEEEHVAAAVAAGADAIGFVFAPNSPRNIDRTLADQLLLQLPSEVLPVAVLQNYGDLQDFSNWPGWLQLCGEEDMDTISSSPRPVIKAVQWSKDTVLEWDNCKGIEAILVDGSTGGLGKMFNVSELASLRPSLQKPIIVAGGLTAATVSEVILTVQPAAVDVSSGVESSRGVKDPFRICEFIEAAIGTN
ncbi:MAG: phosphoribosylanthranilate isomerase [Phycisphaerales bacterium]|jgi:phosphoribosylanthranilate isomerase|nr:phosphoribosylanthranilate isomerase [Phycisphaerales bacterium]